jgi:hypothetical protein
MAEQIIGLLELTAQTVYLVAAHTPGCGPAIAGVADPYPLLRAQLAVQLACDGLERAGTTAPQAMGMAAVLATHLDILREEAANSAARCEDAFPPAAAVFKVRGGCVGRGAPMARPALRTPTAGPGRRPSPKATRAPPARSSPGAPCRL